MAVVVVVVVVVVVSTKCPGLSAKSQTLSAACYRKLRTGQQQGLDGAVNSVGGSVGDR